MRETNKKRKKERERERKRDIYISCFLGFTDRSFNFIIIAFSVLKAKIYEIIMNNYS